MRQEQRERGVLEPRLPPYIYVEWNDLRPIITVNPFGKPNSIEKLEDNPNVFIAENPIQRYDFQRSPSDTLNLGFATSLFKAWKQTLVGLKKIER